MQHATEFATAVKLISLHGTKL